jgi:hypothetical protein
MALNEQSRAAIRRLTSDFKEIQNCPIGGTASRFVDLHFKVFLLLLLKITSLNGIATLKDPKTHLGPKPSFTSFYSSHRITQPNHHPQNSCLNPSVPSVALKNKAKKALKCASLSFLTLLLTTPVIFFPLLFLIFRMGQ